MRIVFWALLCANLVLFALGRGLFGNLDAEEREPARLRNQLAADRLVLLSGAQAQAVAAAAPQDAADTPNEVIKPAAPLPAAAPAAAAPVACVETDAFAAGDARRFEARLAALELGARQTRLTIPFQEATSFMVYLPSQGSKEAADRRVAELQEQGVTNFFVVQGESPMKWAISLGVFKSDAAARTEAETLAKKGVQGVRILPRGPQTQRFAYRFRNIDTAIRGRIVDAGRGMPAAVLHNCR